MNEFIENFLKILFCAILFVGLAVAIVFAGTRVGGNKISEIEIHVDKSTGCEYLSGKGYGITPRLNKAGEQVGCR